METQISSVTRAAIWLTMTSPVIGYIGVFIIAQFLN
jgi:hypothetical protein